MAVVLGTVFVLLFGGMTDCIQLNISQAGNDSPLCLTGNESCASLGFMFNAVETGDISSNLTITLLDEAFLHDVINLTLPRSSFSLEIKGDATSSQLTRITCKNDKSGLSFSGHSGQPSGSSQSISLTNLEISACGPHIPAAVLVQDVDCRIHNCRFVDNKAAAVNIRDGNKVFISNSSFVNNRLDDRLYNFSVVFRFGIHSMGGAVGVFRSHANYSYVDISNCQFHNNSAYVNPNFYSISHDTRKIKHFLSNYYACGGGLILLHAYSTHHNKASVTDCEFRHNSATYGGAMCATFVHSSTNNSVTIERTTMDRNNVSQTAGGLLASYWDYASYNSITVLDVVISRNDAISGGGAKIIFNARHFERVNEAAPCFICFVRCHVTENSAMSGGAFRFLMDLHPIEMHTPSLPVFVNCTIVNSRLSRKSREYPGAILTTRMGLIFQGENTFLGNEPGSAMFLSRSSVHVQGTLTLKRNRGQYGAGLHLTDASRLILYPHSHVRFIENEADFRGGAVYVDTITMMETTYPYNPGCFLQYSIPKTPYHQWQAKLDFFGNSAGIKGAAIFIRNVVGCLWQEFPPYYSFGNVLRWSDSFNYTANRLTYNDDTEDETGEWVDIATDTYKFIVPMSEESFQASPGESIRLNISAVDQLNHPVYSLPSIQQIIRPPQNESREKVLAHHFVILSPANKAKQEVKLTLPSKETYTNLTGSTNTVSEMLQVSDTYSSFMAATRLQLRTIPCHPGFKFVGKSCVCDTSIKGIESCIDGRFLYLKKGYWAGVINGQLVTHLCPRGYCACRRQSPAGGCLFDYKRPDDQCIIGRERTLCGRCKDGLALGLRSTDCRDCTDTGWFLFFVMLLVAAFALLVIYFNPSIPSDLRGILFYVQILPYLFNPNDEVGDVVNTISGILDFGRPSEYPFDTCAVPMLGNLGTTALNYVTPCEVFAILLILFVLRGQFAWTRKHAFQSVFALMILMYKYIAETSFLLVYCVDVGGKSVFFFDGSWECYTGYHRAFASVAWVVIVLFVFAPILAIFLIVKGLVPRMPQPVIDTITCGLKRCSDLSRYGQCKTCQDNKQHRVRYNVNATDAGGQSQCTSVGVVTKRLWKRYVGSDRGWWWGIDLLRRVLLITIYVFVQSWEVKQVLFSSATLVILAIHCAVWPYDIATGWANEIETFFLFCLALLANVQSLTDSKSRQTFSAIILLFTYSFAILYFCWKVTHFFRDWRKNRKPDVTVSMHNVYENR